MMMPRKLLIALLTLLAWQGLALASEPDFKGDDHKPMRFVLGRFETSQDCGPPCADFIIANGEITAYEYFKLLFAHARAGSRPLPLILNSPGGTISIATAMGDIFTKLEMTVIVARAEPVRCTRAKPCKNDEVKPYRLVSRNAGCASACALAIAGAHRRIVPDGSSIGVHRPHLDPEQSLIRTDGKLAKSVIEQMIEDMQSYYVKRGIKPEIMELLKSAESDDMRWLTRDEMLRLGLIDSGDQSLPKRRPSR
jgi:hypothetical protein